MLAPVGSAEIQPRGPMVPVAESRDGLRLCLDAAGDLRTGAIDILVLLDDSGSLQRTDPEGERYQALEVLLVELAALGSGEGFRSRSIALVSYGQVVDVLLPFRPLDASEIGGIVADVRERAPGRQLYTDFIGGVRTAVDLLSDRPSANCRILVWFTDGDHHIAGTPDSIRLEDQLVDASGLRDAFCSPNGLDTRIRERGINTFALMLEPLPTRLEALEASKDVLQVVTGDGEPAFADSDGSRRAPTDVCAGELGDQVGRILPAREAGQLPGLLADLANELEGAPPAVPELSCPYIVDEVTSEALPDAHLIEWFSLTDFRSSDQLRPPDLRRVTVITVDGMELPATQVMEEVSRTDRVLRVRPRADQRDLLQAGWGLRLTGAEQTCLRVLPVGLAFRISTGEPRITVVRPAALPDRLFVDGQLEFIERSGRSTIDLDQALRTTGVAGRLVVDQGQVFSSDSRLPAAIIVDGAPVVDAECASFQIPAPGTLTAGRVGQLGGPEAPTQPLESSTCLVVPATTGDGGSLRWGETLAALNTEDSVCRVGDWTVLVDGVEADTDGRALDVGGAPVLIQFRSLTPPENEERDCTGVALPALVLEWQQTRTSIPVELSVVWARRSSPLIAAAIATPAVLVVILLSLLLLRLINDRWMRPPDADELWGFEVDASLTIDRRGRARIEWARGATGLTVDQEAIGPVTGVGREELRLERTRLVRRMPGWLRPLDEPVLAVAELDQAVASHPPAARGRGTLPLGFREAIVLAASAVRVPTADDPLPVRLAVLVPRSGEVAVSDAVVALVQQRIDQLAERLLERLRELSGDAAGGGSPGGPSGGPGPSGPPGPAGPSGPSGPSGSSSGWGTPSGGVSTPGAPPTAAAPPPVAGRPARRGPAPVTASTNVPEDAPPPPAPDEPSDPNPSDPSDPLDRPAD